MKMHLDHATKPEPDATQLDLERGKKMSGRTFILNFVVLTMLIGPRFSAGDAVAGNVILYDRDGDIYAADIDGSNERQLTSGAPADYMPSISPDGTTIAFSRDYDLYLMNQDGGDQRLRVSKGDLGNNMVHDSDWTPDGEWIYFNAVSGCCAGGLYKVRPDGLAVLDIATIDKRLRAAIEMLSKYKPENSKSRCEGNQEALGHPLSINNLNSTPAAD